MEEAVIRVILEVLPNKIVYVSCNPSTQARDLALMQEHYEIIKSQAVDMFPQTAHVENVVLLQKNKRIKYRLNKCFLMAHFVIFYFTIFAI